MKGKFALKIVQIGEYVSMEYAFALIHTKAMLAKTKIVWENVSTEVFVMIKTVFANAQTELWVNFVKALKKNLNLTNFAVKIAQNMEFALTAAIVSVTSDLKEDFAKFKYEMLR